MLKSIVYLVSGVGGAQLLNLLASPVLSRLYTPHDFGLMGVYGSFVLLFVALSTLSIHFSLPVEKSKEEASVVLSLSGLLSVVFLIIGLLVVTVLFFLGFDFDLSYMLFVLPVSIFFMAYQGIFEHWNSRNESHSVTAIAALSQSVLINLLKIVFGVLGFSYGLVLGQSFLGIVGTVVCFIYIFRHGARFNLLRFRESIALNFDYVVYRTPQILLSSFAQALPVLLFGVIYGAEVVGFFVLAKAIVSAPALILGNAVGNVVAPKLGVVAGTQQFGKEYRKPMLYMLLLGLPCVFIFFFISEWIFSFVYGQDWKEAGSQAAWLSVWYLAFMVVRPAIVAIAVVGAQKELLIFEFFSLIIKTISLFFAYVFNIDALLALAIYSIINVFHYFSIPLLVERKLLITGR